MAPQLAHKIHYTAEEYLAFEEASEQRHDSFAAKSTT